MDCVQNGDSTSTDPSPERPAPPAALTEALLNRFGADPINPVACARSGFPAQAMDVLAEAIGIDVQDMRGLVGATAAQRNLNRIQTGAILRIADAFDAICVVLGGVEPARQWLLTPCRAFGAQAPWRYFDTEQGTRELAEACSAVRFPRGAPKIPLVPAGETPRRIVRFCGGDKEAYLWMHTPNHALGGVRPSELMPAKAGAQHVRSTIDAVMNGSVP